MSDLDGRLTALEQMHANTLAQQAATGEQLTALLDFLRRQEAQKSRVPAPNALTRLRPVSNALPQYPDNAGAPLLVDPYGHVRTIGVCLPRVGPSFTFLGGAQESGPVWIQGADEGPVQRADGPTVDPGLILRGVNVYDAPGRIAAELMTWYFTPDRVNWYAGPSAFSATLGTVNSAPNGQYVTTRGVRLRSAVPVGAAGLTFAVNYGG